MQGRSSIWCKLFKSSKFGRNFENFEKSQNFEMFLKRSLLPYELSEREPGWRFTARCHTETMAKLARLEPAKNGELVTKFGRFSKVLLHHMKKSAHETL